MNLADETPALDSLHHIAISVDNIEKAIEWYKATFRCEVSYQDATWALLEFANIKMALVIPEQHPPHIALLGDPTEFGEPKVHRDGTSSVYLKDPDGNNVEILAPAPETVPSQD